MKNSSKHTYPEAWMRYAYETPGYRHTHWGRIPEHHKDVAVIVWEVVLPPKKARPIKTARKRS